MTSSRHSRDVIREALTTHWTQEKQDAALAALKELEEQLDSEQRLREAAEQQYAAAEVQYERLKEQKELLERRIQWAIQEAQRAGRWDSSKPESLENARQFHMGLISVLAMLRGEIDELLPTSTPAKRPD